MSNEFLPGDIGQLNSGGHKKSVRGPGDDNPDFISCFFFDGPKLVIAEIPPQALVKAQPASASASRRKTQSLLPAAYMLCHSFFATS